MREHQSRLGTRLERTLDKFDIFTCNISLNVFTTVHYESNLTKYSTECRQTFHGMSVLLKETRARGQSKNSSYCFCVLCKSKELGGRVGGGGGGSKIPLCNPSGGKLLLRHSSSHNKLFAESHLESCETSTMELFCKTSQRPYNVD